LVESFAIAAPTAENHSPSLIDQHITDLQEQNSLLASYLPEPQMIESV